MTESHSPAEDIVALEDPAEGGGTPAPTSDRADEAQPTEGGTAEPPPPPATGEEVKARLES